MTAMTAREFVDTIAVPTVEEFMVDPSQRRGYLACLTVYHVADYLKPTGQLRADEVHEAMEAELGLPFLALQRMADAVKHREKTQGKSPGLILMQSGSDLYRPASGFDTSSEDSPFRFDDIGGRYITSSGYRYDMLDLCAIVLRAYAKLYPAELSGSTIDGIRYSTATYPKA